jgi:hypothetical protein
MRDKLSDFVDQNILKIIEDFKNSCQSFENNFEELISMGELIDRLSIVNFKLYTLKDEVMKRPEDSSFGAWASIEDVKLCKERSRLKICIDEKIISLILKVKYGDDTAGFNPEVKKYGN